MAERLTAPDRVTPEWLTDTLRRAGALPSGTVTACVSRANAAFNSFTTHLDLTYSADAPADAPPHLLLKRGRPEGWAVAAGAREAAFYALMMPPRAALPMVVPCHAAGHDAASGQAFVLLRDLSASHRPPLTRDQQLTPGENVPSAVDLARSVEALARFHAAWWEHPRLGGGGAPFERWFRDRADFERYRARRAEGWARLIAEEGAWFPDHLRRLYERVVARLPRLWERYLEPRLATLTNVTLAHGDAYFANFLCPIDPDSRDATYLIDWQSPGVHIGAFDLVTMCATFWTPAQRREDGREAGVLRRYHAALQARGVRDYAWEDLLTDYKLAVIDWLLTPVQDRHDGSKRDYWWPKMQCLAGACEDLGCLDLLTA